MEVPTSWNPSDLTIADPADHSNPILYDPATGLPRAAVIQATPQNGWLPDPLAKHAIESFNGARPEGEFARDDRMKGKLVVNGSLVCADLGLLAPGNLGSGGSDNPPGSPFSVGLRLNYDERTKGMLNVRNPNQVTIHRALWMPTATP